MFVYCIMYVHHTHINCGKHDIGLCSHTHYSSPYAAEHVQISAANQPTPFDLHLTQFNMLGEIGVSIKLYTTKFMSINFICQT